MLTLGGMWHFDAARTWNVSALSRYEIKTEQDDTGLTPGDSWLVEWGAAIVWPSAGGMLKGTYYHEYDASAGGLKGVESEGDALRLQFTKFL